MSSKADLKEPLGGPILSAMKTLSFQQKGLAALYEAIGNGLGSSFQSAIEAIGAISGRVIVTGVGKSGHIGSKIAATLASTGTPAFFVHPAEANHGDLGMIARDDAIIAMSWSGETQELSGILRYSRRFEIPLIAITAGAESTLAREADIVLVMPKADEACPHGLAPTTSTLMQLAIGDALALADAEQAEGPGVIGVPVGDPAGGKAVGEGRVAEVHGQRPGGQFLLPDGDLVILDGRGHHHDGDRRGGQLGEDGAGLVGVGLVVGERLECMGKGRARVGSQHHQPPGEELAVVGGAKADPEDGLEVRIGRSGAREGLGRSRAPGRQIVDQGGVAAGKGEGGGKLSHEP